MAASNLQLKGMQDLATCGICLELFTDARTLSCSHCFCLNCLLALQNSEKIKACPTCRRKTVSARSVLHRLENNKPANDLVAFLRGKGDDSLLPALIMSAFVVLLLL